MLIAALTAGVLFAAYFVRGVAGFGSALIAIPLLALEYPLIEVVPLVVLLDWLGSALQGGTDRSAIRWREILPILPFSVVGIALALYGALTLAPRTLELLFGGFIVAFALYQLLPTPDVRGPRWLCAPFGAIGGLVGTLFGTGGPFYMIFLSLRGLSNAERRASFAACFIADGALRLLGYAAGGLLGIGLLTAHAWWLVPALIGLLLGGRVHLSLSPAVFRRGISVILLLSGYRLLVG